MRNGVGKSPHSRHASMEPEVRRLFNQIRRHPSVKKIVLGRATVFHHRRGKVIVLKAEVPAGFSLVAYDTWGAKEIYITCEAVDKVEVRAAIEKAIK